MQIFEWNPWTMCEAYDSKSKYYVLSGCYNCPYKGKPKIEVSDIRTPTKLAKDGKWLIPSYSVIKTCTKSDFFDPSADRLRQRVWKIIRERKDCLFIIETKQVHRIEYVTPSDWKLMTNVMIYTSISDTIENYRIKQLLNIENKYLGLNIAPLYTGINIENYLSTQQIIDVRVSGEYLSKNSRVMFEDDLYSLYKQCKKHNINFHVDNYADKVELMIHPIRDDGTIRVTDTLHLDNLSEENRLKVTQEYGKYFNVDSDYNLEYIMKRLKAGCGV